jgi:hypothetical protein
MNRVCAVAILVFTGFSGASTLAHEAPKRSDASVEFCERLLATDSPPLRADWVVAASKIDAMNRALTTMSATERGYFHPIVKAAVSALTKHQKIFDSERDLKSLDVARHLAILRAIGNFTTTQARFSLYKINRAIEGRYSLREYADCRE